MFSLYLIALSCLPCRDVADSHAATIGTNTTIYVISGKGSPAHEHCDDNCSPFCGCHCCTTVYTVKAFPALAFHKVALIGKKTVFPNLSCMVNDVALAIDHPPQLV